MHQKHDTYTNMFNHIFKSRLTTHQHVQKKN